MSSSVPPLMIRIRPVCSTTNRRPDPSPASVTSNGFDRPVATGVSPRWIRDGTTAAVAAGAAGPTSRLASRAAATNRAMADIGEIVRHPAKRARTGSRRLR